MRQEAEASRVLHDERPVARRQVQREAQQVVRVRGLDLDHEPAVQDAQLARIERVFARRPAHPQQVAAVAIRMEEGVGEELLAVSIAHQRLRSAQHGLGVHAPQRRAFDPLGDHHLLRAGQHSRHRHARHGRHVGGELLLALGLALQVDLLPQGRRQTTKERPPVDLIGRQDTRQPRRKQAHAT